MGRLLPGRLPEADATTRESHLDSDGQSNELDGGGAGGDSGGLRDGAAPADAAPADDAGCPARDGATPMVRIDYPDDGDTYCIDTLEATSAQFFRFLTSGIAAPNSVIAAHAQASWTWTRARARSTGARTGRGTQRGHVAPGRASGSIEERLGVNIGIRCCADVAR